MANNKKWGTKFLTIISALSLVGAGALVAISPASAENTLPATETLLTFEDDDAIGADAVGANGDADPQGSFGGMVSVIADGTNTTGKVLNLPKNGESYSGIVLAKFEDRRISTGTSATFEFDFYSPETAAVSVLLKVEAADAGINKEISFDAAPGWNRYTQTISDLNADVDYVTLVLIPNFGSAAGGTVAVSGQVYAIDNVGINGAELPLLATPTLLTFEDDDTIGADAVGANGEGDPQGSFEGMVSEIGDAANGGGTGKVLLMPKNGFAWSGMVLAKFDDRRIATGTSATFEFDLYSPEAAAVSVLLKVEAADANINKEISFDAAPGWNRYTRTISDLNADVDYVTLVLIPNFGTAAGGTVAVSGQVYAIDNVGFNGAELPALPDLPLPATPTLLTFEDDDTIGADAVGTNGEGDPQGSFEGMVSEIGDAANGGGTGKVLLMPKNGEAWSGMVLAKFDDRRIATGTSATFEFDLYSPEAAAVSVLLKVEAADANINKEISFDAAPGWNRYTQTISDLNADVDYVTLVLIPNFGSAAGGTVAVNGQVYAIDNVGFNGAELPALPEFAPVKTKNPTITGTAKVGKKLTANGFISSWEGEPTLAYQWFACTKKGTNNPSVKPADCKTISGASATKLTLKKAQKGKFIRVRVTATNDAGSTAVFSDSTKVKVS
jgi:hypothetical protein